MPESTQSQVVAQVAERLDPHFAAEGFSRPSASHPGELSWIKRPDDAPGDELDKVAIRVEPPRDGRSGWAIRGWAWSWTRTAPVNLRVLAIEHREPGAPATPSGWLCTSPAAVQVVLDELERLVHGQLIGWLDEPVPLGANDSSLPPLTEASEQLLGDLVVPNATSLEPTVTED